MGVEATSVARAKRSLFFEEKKWNQHFKVSNKK
jgi:hypothetical protein